MFCRMRFMRLPSRQSRNQQGENVHGPPYSKVISQIRGSNISKIVRAKIDAVLRGAAEQALAADALPRYFLCELSERAAEARRSVATCDMKHSVTFAISLVLLAAAAGTNRTNGS